MAKDRIFHIYEGGEGTLPIRYTWIHALYGSELMESGDYTKAEKIFYDGIDIPKSFGEAKTIFNEEAHIFYSLGLLYEMLGETKKAKRAFEEAAIDKKSVSEITMFRAYALKKLGNETLANAVLDEMLSVAENRIVNKDLRSYYGVGTPSPMPFEYDIEKNNLTDGYILKAFALLGYNKKGEAEEAIEEARKLNPYDFRIFAFDRVK